MGTVASPAPADRPHGSAARRIAIGVTAGLLVYAAVMVLAWRLDARADRQRPLYREVLAMATLQYDQVKAQGRPVAVRVEPGTTVSIGGRAFTASPGVTIRVRRADDGGYCVRGWERGEGSTRWLCFDGTTPPGSVP